MNFLKKKTYLNSINVAKDLYSINSEEVRDYKVLALDQVDFLADKLAKADEVVFDLETTGLNPFKDSIRLIGFNLLREKEIFALPFKSSQIEELSAFFSNPSILKVGHNLKFDVKFLRRAGLSVNGPYFDTMVAHSLLDENSLHGLSFLSKHYISPFAGFYEDRKDLYMSSKDVGWSDIPLDILGLYCCEDVDYTGKLKKTFEFFLSNQNLLRVFNIDMKVLECLIDMDLAGLTFDLSRLSSVRKEVYDKALELRESLLRLAGLRFKKVNLSSPKQIAEILYQKLNLPILKRSAKTNSPSTDAEVLALLAQKHKFPKLLLSYRKIDKLLSSYLDSDVIMNSLYDGRVHTNFSQHVTVTGRLSCNEPNLQAIPKETNVVRQLFIASPGFKLFSADYSQIELKILAFCSRDPEMLSAYRQGIDLHKLTAAKLYDISIDKVVREQRNLAKTINFGIIYGMTANGLANIANIRYNEAEVFIQKYFDIYKGVNDFIELTKQELYSDREVVNYLGRRRRFPNFFSYSTNQRQKVERQAVNFKIQSFAAYVVKLAMIKTRQFLSEKSPLAKMLLQLHDEIVLELPEEHLSYVPQLVDLLVEPPFEGFDIPLEVSSEINNTWGDSSKSSFEDYLGLDLASL